MIHGQAGSMPAPHQRSPFGLRIIFTEPMKPLALAGSLATKSRSSETDERKPRAADELKASPFGGPEMSQTAGDASTQAGVRRVGLFLSRHNLRSIHLTFARKAGWRASPPRRPASVVVHGAELRGNAPELRRGSGKPENPNIATTIQQSKRESWREICKSCQKFSASFWAA